MAAADRSLSKADTGVNDDDVAAGRVNHRTRVCGK